MLTTQSKPQWEKRLSKIESEVEGIRFPDGAPQGLAQDAEWCEVRINGQEKRIRLHDYDEIFEIPGLYEELFYGELKCCSPNRMARLLEDVVTDLGESVHDLTVLDVGAGNGMVGDELHARSVKRLVGIDIIPEAQEATQRDRPEVYDDYLVTDLTDLPERQEEHLQQVGFNCMITVAALGFGDMPPQAFLKALDLVETPGWAAFTIKEDFLREEDESGFCRLVAQLNRQQVIQIQAYRRFRHRLSTVKKPLFYVAVVAKKLTDVPDSFLDGDWNDRELD